jgi:predicted Zn-dependent protease with MMP-like domain
MESGRWSRLALQRSFQRRYRPTHQEFERLVGEAVEGLPAEFRARLDNVAIVVEAWPRGGRRADDLLLGLYEGVPLTQRGEAEHLALPDRITIFSGPTLALCRTRAEAIREIRATVVHEVGHFFGLGDDELD